MLFQVPCPLVRKMPKLHVMLLNWSVLIFYKLFVLLSRQMQPDILQRPEEMRLAMDLLKDCENQICQIEGWSVFCFYLCLSVCLDVCMLISLYLSLPLSLSLSLSLVFLYLVFPFKYI